ncbi:MAG TPA: helix-turn-helix transcriptional regulator [Natronosporangium sp.]
MTTSVHSPTAGRRRLRHALRRARDQAGLTQEQVSEAMDWSLSKVIRIESGGVGISTTDLRQLLQLYQVTDPAEVDELVELARIGRQRPWWTRYRDSLPPAYLSYVGLEDESSALRCVNPVGLPGLLQTEEYARALVSASWWAASTVNRTVIRESELDAAVEVRKIRQREVLHRPSPPQITAILDEAVLWRQIGGADVLRRQLHHLIALGQEPHISVRVLPFRTGVLHVLSPFVVIEFPDPADSEVVYVENVVDHTIVDGAEVVIYRNVFDQLQQASLAEAESLELIARVADELKAG